MLTYATQSDSRIFGIALSSRLLFLLIGVCSDALLKDYDSSAQLQTASCDQQLVDDADITLFTRSVRSSIVWDSVYFERIARCGYEFEHFLAFFPGWPGASRLLSGWRPPWTQVAGLTLSCCSFCLSAVLLRRCAHHDASDIYALVPSSPCTGPYTAWSHDAPEC